MKFRPPPSSFDFDLPNLGVPGVERPRYTRKSYRKAKARAKDKAAKKARRIQRRAS